MSKASRKFLLINVSVTVLVALILWLFLGRSKSSLKESTESRNGITIVTELSPNNFVIEENGVFGGLQADLANLFFPDTATHWLPSDSRQKSIEALLSGEADVYASSIPLASEKEYEGTVSTIPIYTTAFALVYPKGTDWIADFSDPTKNAVIYGSKDDPAVARIVQNISDLSYPSLRYVSLDQTSQEVALDVFRKKITYALVEKELATKIAETIGDSIAISTDLTFSSNQVWLIKEGRDSLLNTLNDRIKTAKNTSAYDKIISRNAR